MPNTEHVLYYQILKIISILQKKKTEDKINSLCVSSKLK